MPLYGLLVGTFSSQAKSFVHLSWGSYSTLSVFLAISFTNLMFLMYAKKKCWNRKQKFDRKMYPIYRYLTKPCNSIVVSTMLCCLTSCALKVPTFKVLLLPITINVWNGTLWLVLYWSPVILQHQSQISPEARKKLSRSLNRFKWTYYGQCHCDISKIRYGWHEIKRYLFYVDWVALLLVFKICVFEYQFLNFD